MRIELLKPSDYQRTPWKNGLGFTDQIAIHPPAADLRRGDFLWRLSSARIEKSAPFSNFVNHDRVLVVLEGAGVRLSHTYEPGEPPEVMDLPAYEPYEFPGDVPTTCELVDGPIRDLSVFIAKGQVSVLTDRVSLEPGDARPWSPEGATAFIFVARGALELGGQIAHAGETLRLELDPHAGAPELELRAADSSTEAICIQLS